MDTITVPITLDGIFRPQAGSAAPEDLSRCIYFTMVAEDPSQNWELVLGNQRIPFILLGLSGIIHSPVSDGPEFDTADQLDSLIETIESISSPYAISVETGVLWVPTRWLDLAVQHWQREGRVGAGLSRGQVFRISQELFVHLWRVMDERAILDDDWSKRMLSDRQDATPPLRFAQTETDVFATWTVSHLGGSQGTLGFQSAP